jgi:hypothetical protein
MSISMPHFVPEVSAGFPDALDLKAEIRGNPNAQVVPADSAAAVFRNFLLSIVSSHWHPTTYSQYRTVFSPAAAGIANGTLGKIRADLPEREAVGFGEFYG